MVVANEDVEHCVTRSTCHAFDNLIWDGWDSGVADGDGIERLKVVDQAKGATLFVDAKPVQAIQGVGRLVNACHNFLLEDFDDICKHTWRNRKVLVHPRGMFNNGNFDRGEIVITKPSLLCFHPS